MTATYITTTIPYVNARPHPGHALELVQADVLARYHRGAGGQVRFQAGTDGNSAARGAPRPGRPAPLLPRIAPPAPAVPGGALRWARPGVRARPPGPAPAAG